MKLHFGIGWVLFSLLISSCMGDMAVIFRGQFVDENHQPYKKCTFSVEYRSTVIDQVNVSGEFLETVVFRPTSFAPLIANGSCKGTEEIYVQEIEEVPKDFGVPVELGDIVLKRDESN